MGVRKLDGCLEIMDGSIENMPGNLWMYGGVMDGLDGRWMNGCPNL